MISSFFKIIFILQEMLNNKTTYSNGESQLSFKFSINVISKFHSNKIV
jgi:hypothetical protein